ncbi:haloacid dehalogenase type II [Stappia sp.]|uniref:haloacid dehalogenase type II n=1 Tax=Stappia sp. TaxID=1870903 RepID=UPI0032D96362
MVKAIFFDVFGTVVDWRSGLTTLLDKAFAKSDAEIDAGALARTWHRRVHMELRVRIEAGADYAPLDTLHAQALTETLEDAGLAHHLTREETARLARGWERLPPWPDSTPGLRALRRDYVLAPCTAASIAMTTWLAKHANLPFDLMLGADIARAYPPAPEVFHASAAIIGLAPEEVMLASAHNADLAAARAAGLKTAFFARPHEHGPDQASDLAPEDDWEIEAYDLLDLARQMETAGF